MLLILGQKEDPHIYRALNYLHWKEGVDFIIFDRYSSPSVSISPSEVIKYLENVKSIWRRIKPPVGNIEFKYSEIEEWNYFNKEWAVVEEYIQYKIPKEKHISSFDSNVPENNKIVQIEVAKSCGFKTPKTIISTVSEDVIDYFGSQKVVFKQFSSVASGKKGVLLTTLVDKRKIHECRNEISICPGIFQEYIEKSAEIRVNVFGGEFYSAEMKKKRLPNMGPDWRLGYHVPGAMLPCRIDRNIERFCLDYLECLGLKHGVFDFAIDFSGDTYFLECNPCGQYTFVEDLTGQPLSEAMGRLLALCVG